jgi:hypothetical protein
MNFIKLKKLLINNKIITNNLNKFNNQILFIDFLNEFLKSNTKKNLK